MWQWTRQRGSSEKDKAKALQVRILVEGLSRLKVNEVAALDRIGLRLTN